MPSSLFKNSMTLVSFVIPTLNCSASLQKCLQSIKKQTFKSYSIIIVDGGSIDKTLKIAKKYHCQILANPLKTAEAGKAIGVKKAKSKYVALVDSDNILPSADWLQKMIDPLENNNQLIGSEPWSYTYRRQGGFIERYSALTGVNDPYTLIAGNFDRKNFLFPKWTNLPLEIVDYSTYQSFELDPKKLIPTIGANGTVFRTSLFADFNQNYLFDIDVLSSLKTKIYFAKVKVGIIHTYCESSISKFYRKQIRRATDLYTYQNLRTYSLTQNNLFSTIKFILYVVLVIPMLIDTIKGFIKKPDSAWLFHPPACLITLYCYSLITLKHRLGVLKPQSRQLWHQ